MFAPACWRMTTPASPPAWDAWQPGAIPCLSAATPPLLPAPEHKAAGKRPLRSAHDKRRPMGKGPGSSPRKVRRPLPTDRPRASPTGNGHADAATPMICPTFSGSQNVAGDTVPAARSKAAGRDEQQREVVVEPHSGADREQLARVVAKGGGEDASSPMHGIGISPIPAAEAREPGGRDRVVDPLPYISPRRILRSLTKRAAPGSHRGAGR